MHLRRSYVTAAAAVLLAVLPLSSCGFDYNTDRVNTNGATPSNRDGTVDILAATVVASAAGEGTFIASLSNNDQAEEAVFESLEAGEGEDAVSAVDFEQVQIAPGGFVNLADGAGVKITGSFGAGDVISLTLGFAGGETTTQDVSVVRACGEYEGLDPEVEPSPTASPTEVAETDPSQAPTLEASPVESTEPLVGESAEPVGDLYSCDLTDTEPEE